MALANKNQTGAGDLTREEIPVLVRRVAIPASVGFFFNTMFNVVDTYYAGLISTSALAALSLSFPVFFCIIALGAGFSTGATALIGNSLGSGHRKRAGLYADQALVLGLFISALLTAFGLLASPWLFGILGAEGEYLDVCLDYMRVIFAGCGFFLMNYALNSVLVSLGNTRVHRNFLIASFLANVGLDPWFIYGGFGLPAMGISGIALATVIVQIGGTAYLGLMAYRTGLLSTTGARGFIPRFGALKDILRQGLPASLNYLTVGLGIFIITYFLSFFGKEAVAAYGAAVRVEQIFLLPTIGLNTATLSLVSQNFGAGEYERVRQTVRTALKYGLWVMLAGGAALYLLAEHWLAIFTDNAQVIADGVGYLRIASFVLFAYVVLYVHVSALQGLKKPLFALWIGLYRQILAPFAGFWLLAVYLDWGTTGVWWGIAIITWSAAIIAYFYARRRLQEVGVIA